MLVQHSGVAWAIAALFVAASISLALQLGIARAMAWAAARAVLQLSLVGFILSHLFRLQSSSLTLAAILLMTGFALNTVLKRLSGTAGVVYSGVQLHVLLSLIFGVWFLSLGAVHFVLADGSWRKAEIILPFVGLLLGNSVSGISLGLTSWTHSLRNERDLIETRLAQGASSWEAVYPVVQQAMKTAMTPILNSMTVAGVVNLPGMMTGQLLAGSDLGVAVRYQIVALLLIATSTFLGSLLAIMLGYQSLFTSGHQLQYAEWMRHA